MSDSLVKLQCFRKDSMVPKYLLQGDLFPARKCPEPLKTETLIKTFEGTELLVHHDGFTQFDLAVSLAYKRIINQSKNISNVEFTIAEFAKALNRVDGGKTRSTIIEAFKRSNSFYMNFEMNDDSFSGYRLTKFEEVEMNKFKVAFNIDYMNMVYDESDVVYVDLDLFFKLNFGLQSWLYGLFCSLPHMNQIDMDTLYDLSGVEYKNQSDFKKAIKESLGALNKAGIIGWRYGVTRSNEVYWDNSIILKLSL